MHMRASAVALVYNEKVPFSRRMVKAHPFYGLPQYHQKDRSQHLQRIQNDPQDVFLNKTNHRTIYRLRSLTGIFYTVPMYSNGLEKDPGIKAKPPADISLHEGSQRAVKEILYFTPCTSVLIFFKNVCMYYSHKFVSKLNKVYSK